MSVTSKKRLFNLDVIRMVGLLLIIFNHALNTVWDATNYSYWLSSTLYEKIFILIGYSICRLGVPLFLMITGALILNKNFDSWDDIFRFYKRNLCGLVIVIMVWNVIYYFFNLFYYDNSFSVKDLLYILLFMKNSTMPHMWYMSMIVGMYLFLPYLSAIVKKFSFNSVIFPIIVAVFFFFLLPNFKTLLIFLGFRGTYIKTLLDLSFSGGTYGVYIILGYYLYTKKVFGKIKEKYLALGIVLGILLSCIFQAFGYLNNSSYIVYYNFIGILLAGVFMFEVLRRVRINFSSGIKNIITNVSKFSLGIYFVHRPLLFLFKKYFILNFNPCINVIIYYIISIMISYFVVSLLKKINIFKKYLFLIKD